MMISGTIPINHTRSITICLLISLTDSPIKTKIIIQAAISSSVNPNTWKDSTKSAPPINSMIGWMMGILDPQWWHFPLFKKKPKKGMISIHLSCVLHVGQCDLPLMDSCCGIRSATKWTNDVRVAPSMKMKIEIRTKTVIDNYYLKIWKIISLIILYSF